MERKRFVHSLDQIYGTAEKEIDCQELQRLLPTYVEMQIARGDATQQFPAVHTHLLQCPDCAEEYRGLREVAEIEARGELPAAEKTLATFEPKPEPEPEETASLSLS